MHVGDRIKQARKAKGWTQQKLATEAGVTRPAVTQYEAGTSVPKRPTLQKIASLLNVSERWLLDGVDGTSGGEQMPVRGEVAAGVWREALDLDLEPIPVSPSKDFPLDAQYGLLVRGDSMDRIASDSEYLHVVDVLTSGVSPRPGDIVVVKKHRHGTTEATAKRLASQNGKLVLIGESNNPRFQGTIQLDPADDDTEIVISAIVIGKYAAISRG